MNRSLAVVAFTSLVAFAGCDLFSSKEPTRIDAAVTPDAADVSDAVDVPEQPDIPDDYVWDIPQPDADAQPDLADEPDAPPPECTPDDALFTCDDDDACTADTCADGACVNAPIAGCCLTDADCDDGVACTDDSCSPVGHKCLNLKQDNTCCLDASDCGDDDPCTEDVCAANRCVHPVKAAAAACGCLSPITCDDGNPCTVDACAPGGTCAYEPDGAAGCCATDADCDDGDPGTADSCQQSTCWNAAVPCVTDADCVAPTPCLTGSCGAGGTCDFAPLDAAAAPTGCCVTDAGCDDGLPATTDACIANRCVHVLGAATSCEFDTDCPGTACASASCVVEASTCSVLPTGGSGCCATTADCPAPADFCHAATCADFTCGTDALSGDQPFWLEPFPTSDLAGWTTTPATSGVGWTAWDDQAVSAPYSLYYGDPATGTYQTAGPNAGVATSPLITPPDGATGLRLRLWVSADIEPLVSSDHFDVVIVPDGGAAETVAWSKQTAGLQTGWQQLDVDIDAAAASGPFRVELRFDTVDDVNNDGDGIYVDDVAVTGSCD